MPFEIITTGGTESSIRVFARFLETYCSAHPDVAFEFKNLDWNDAWPTMVRTAIEKGGPSLSEVGAPWVSDFAAMNSLRPFSAAEVEAVGGVNAFFPVPWTNALAVPAKAAPEEPAGAKPASGEQNGSGAQKAPGSHSAPLVYALPARVDVRVIYYWKDMLEKAGVDPVGAFTTPEQVEHTFVQLRASQATPACATPWVLQTHATRSWVYNMASWIWACGGDFVDEKGLPVFDQPAAIDGMTAFFRLLRFLAPVKDGDAVEKVFSQRRAAVMLMGTHYHVELMQGNDRYGHPSLMPLLGAAPLPGPAFVGGSSFVIWEHSSYKATRAAVDLLTQFQNSASLPEYCYEGHMLPGRVDGLCYPAFATDPFLPVLRASMEKGRCAKSARMWMLIAERLSYTCRAISIELRQNPDQDVRALVERNAHALAHRLRISFSGA